MINSLPLKNSANGGTATKIQFRCNGQRDIRRRSNARLMPIHHFVVRHQSIQQYVGVRSFGRLRLAITKERNANIRSIRSGGETNPGG